MSMCYDPVWRLTLRTPQSLVETDLNDFVFEEKDGIPGSSCRLMRILDPPLMVDGSVQSMVPMQFHIIGTIVREDCLFKVSPKGEGTETSVSLLIAPRPGAPARIEWEQQISKLEEAVSEAGGTRHVNVRTLVTREPDPRTRKIRIVDMERRGSEEEPGYTMRTPEDIFFNVRDGASLPFDKAVRVVFTVDCMPMSNMGKGLFAIGRVKTISLV